MFFETRKGSQRPASRSFALHIHRCSLIVLLWSHCSICISLRRRNHCCRDELCCDSCADPPPNMEPCLSPQTEACSGQRRPLHTKDYIFGSFLILQWDDSVRECSCFFPETIVCTLSSKGDWRAAWESRGHGQDGFWVCTSMMWAGW